MKLPEVLLVEDEPAHQMLISKALDGHCDMDLAPGFNEALLLLSKGKKYKLIILDIMLGDGDGFDLCSRLRKMNTYELTPVIFLTSKSEVSSKVLGFNLGADDYIVKPCDPAELRARVEAKIRWSQKGSLETQMIKKEGPFVFYLSQQRLDVNREGKEETVDLTPIEFKLMYYLVSHQEHVLSRDQILNAVWGPSTHVLDRSVDTYIAALRRKVTELKECLRAVHGVGYKFSLESKRLTRAS